MSASASAAVPPDDVALFRDSVLVMSVRRELDQLLLDALAAPGLGLEAAKRVSAYVTGGRLNEGQEALTRIASRTQEA